METTTRAMEQRLLTDAVERLERQGAFGVVFGGIVGRDGVEICSLRGNRFDLLSGLVVAADRGLGGKALAEGRPRIAADYRAARHITHDYDREVLSERIRTLLAVPVVVSGRVRGVIYGGLRSDGQLGQQGVAPAVSAATELARELEVADRLGDVHRRRTPSDSRMPTARLEELRESYAELRSICATVSDTALRERLLHLEDRLVRLAGGGPSEQSASGEAATPAVRLSPRECDVLGFVALGRTSVDIATELGLTESTVKSYLAASMRKLDAHTRHEAVAAARKHGLLP